MNPVENEAENPSTDQTSSANSPHHSEPSLLENTSPTVVLRSHVPIERSPSFSSGSPALRPDSTGTRWLRMQSDCGESYLDRKTGEQWILTADSSGRPYYYEARSHQSVWELEDFEDAAEEAGQRTQTDPDSVSQVIVDQEEKNPGTQRASTLSTSESGCRSPEHPLILPESAPTVSSVCPIESNPLEAAAPLANGRVSKSGKQRQRDSTKSRWLRYRYDGEETYVDQKNGEQWVLTTDSNGVPYYYQVNSERSVWALDDIQDCVDAEPNDPRLSTLSSSDSLSPLLEQQASLAPKKALVDSGEQSPQTAVPSGNSSFFDVTRMNKAYISGPQENKLAHFERRGLAKYAKLTVNDRRVKKRWNDCLLVLSGPWFLIYKDNKSATPKPNNPYGKPEAKLHVQLIEPSDATDSETSKENVLKIEQKDARGVSTAYLIQMPSNVIDCWKAAIRYAQQLMEEEKLLTPSLARDNLKNFTRPPSKLDNGVLSKMLEFFRSRPSPEVLRSRGILKNEPVFASTLVQICESENSDVPRFVVCAVRAIEARDLNHLGLYRISANAAVVQKLRCCVNQYNYSLNSDRWTLDVLAGALKLFFRELKEPLFTFNAFEQISTLFASKKSGAEMIESFREILNSMPNPHFATARVLFHHLTRVQNHAEQNQMHIHKLALVFGPSLLRSEKDTESLAMLTSVQAPCVDFCLTHVVDLFGPVVPPPVVV